MLLTNMKCSSAIAESFEKHCRHQEEVQQKRVDKMPLKDLMTHWFESIDQAGEPLNTAPIETADIPESTTGSIDEAEPEPELPELDAYRKIISSSPAYKWLCSTLQRIMLTEPDSSDELENISSTINSLLPMSYRVSKRTGPVAHQVTYKVALDLWGFIEDQEYEESPADAVLNAITITGNSEFTQATTCAEYLLQTWPSTATCMIEALKGIFEHRSGGKHMSKWCLPFIL